MDCDTIEYQALALHCPRPTCYTPIRAYYRWRTVDTPIDLDAIPQHRRPHLSSLRIRKTVLHVHPVSFCPNCFHHVAPEDLYPLLSGHGMVPHRTFPIEDETSLLLCATEDSRLPEIHAVYAAGAPAHD